MGQSAEELRESIAETRGELGGTVDAISDQVSPARIVERKKAQVRSRWTSAKEAVMGQAADARASASGVGDTLGNTGHSAIEQTQGRPMVAGAVAFGVGFLLAALFPGTQTEGELAERAQEAVRPAVDQIKQSGQEAVSALKAPAQEAAQQLKDTATQSAGHLSDTAQGAVAESKDAATQAGQQIADQAKTAGQNVREA